MECEKIQEKFSALLEGDLDSSEEKIVREHVASCSKCQRDFEAFKKTMNWLHSVDEVGAPEGFLTEIYQKIEDRRGMGYRREWVHRLVRLKLPAQAVAMVAIVLAVLYVAKMIPMETHREKDVDSARTPPSEVRTDTHSAQKEAKTEKQKITLLSEAPGTKEMGHEKAPLSEGKEIEKAAIPSLAARPSQEIVLRVPDQERAIFQLQGLLKELGGEIARQEGYILFASLPTGSYTEFGKRLEGMVSPRKAEPAAPQQGAPSASRIPPRAKEEASVRKEKEMGRPMADRTGRITVRIVVVKE